MPVERAFVLLFVVATAVAIASRRLRIPYTVALVLAGLLLGASQLFPAPQLTATLLFSVLLPGLIFEAAFHIEAADVRANLLTITSLAVPGVIVSTCLTAATLPPLLGVLHLTPSLDWKAALAFGALISATDPIAVVALFRRIGAPARLTTLLEGESLLNDGTAIVFFALSLAVLSGSVTTAPQLAVQFISIVGGGAAVGIAIGLTAAAITRRIDDAMIEITLTMVAAYGSFAAAEALRYSGVIATVAAGILCGSFGARAGGMSPTTRLAAESFWEYVAFALNSVVFLLVGLRVQVSTLLAYWLPILVAYVVVTLARGLMLSFGWSLLSLTAERFPWRWCPVLTWGGVRGALPMVLAMSLPRTLASRDLLISMTFGVALLSILAQGITMSALIRWLRIEDETSGRSA